MPFPWVGADALEDARRQANGITPVFTINPRTRPILNAVDEMFQLARQLVPTGSAIALEHLQVTAKQFIFQQGARYRVELARIQAVPAELLGGLDKGEPALGEIDARITFR